VAQSTVTTVAQTVTKGMGAPRHPAGQHAAPAPRHARGRAGDHVVLWARTRDLTMPNGGTPEKRLWPGTILSSMAKGRELDEKQNDKQNGAELNPRRYGRARAPPHGQCEGG